MKYLLFIVFTFTYLHLAGQKETTLDKAYQKEYDQRIKKEMLFGVYIPLDLEDAFSELKRLSPTADLEKFKHAPEEIIKSKLHFGLGRWMIYNWGFYEGSRLSHYLKQLGLTYPDDMAKFMLVSFHRHLNMKPLDIEGQIKDFQENRDEEFLKREAQKDTLKLETRIRKQ